MPFVSSIGPIWIAGAVQWLVTWFSTEWFGYRGLGSLIGGGFLSYGVFCATIAIIRPSIFSDVLGVGWARAFGSKSTV
jgi:hypothetical protein